MADTDFGPLESAARLLSAIGQPRPESAEELPGGRNNRVWKILSAGNPFLLKRYRWSPDDPRDRLGQEWAFLTFLRKSGIAAAPAPLAKDEAVRAALLEFIGGSPVPPDEVTAEDVRIAADFFQEINRHRDRGTHLPPVSEGCFSIGEHVAATEKRVARLKAMPADKYPEACEFVHASLIPVWKETSARLSAVKNCATPLPLNERCLSPSDFGFHNTLRQHGRLRFVDFEYAGWDDPAKTVADFCNQPDGILPDRFGQIFRDAVAELFPSSFRERIRILEPVYQIKWACICLNPFLPQGRFDPNRPDRSPDAQLARAKMMVRRSQESAP